MLGLVLRLLGPWAALPWRRVSNWDYRHVLGGNWWVPFLDGCLEGSLALEDSERCVVFSLKYMVPMFDRVLAGVVFVPG